MPARKPSRAARKTAADHDEAATYDAFKEFEGRRYTGMRVGRSHKWYYDQGEWKETKLTPDEWKIEYSVTKRRAGKAPEGSGVPVGTGYHWYILAHQNVTKLNANEYSTSMTGMKFKLAHKRANSESWSATPEAQRKRLIEFLHEVVRDLEKQVVSLPRAKKTRPRATPSARTRSTKKRATATRHRSAA